MLTKTSNRSRLAFALVLGAALAGGCAQNMRYDNDTQTAAITLEPSSHDIMAGEIVTVVAHTRNTYGQNAKIEWSSTGGKLTTEQSGRIARVRFDQIGTYTIRALLKANGQDVESSMVQVNVRPIR